MGDSGHGRLTRRPGPLVLAFAALLLQVLVPAGYMVGSGPSPGLVICTGHGPLGSQDHRGDAPAKSHDGACVFAGHGVALASPAPVRLPAQVIVERALAVTVAFEQTPGRGLAAPPPPPRGPPDLI
jgi:hypothetical protein